MAIVAPFLRKLVLTIGPVAEWQGAASGSGDVLELISDGTQQNFKITASVNKTVMGAPNPSTIAIYNLSRKTRNSIQKGLTKVVLEAGWENTAMHTVLQGSIMSVANQKQGVDTITQISVLQGYGGMVRGVSSKSYSEGVQVKEALKSMAKDMPGVNVADALIKNVKGYIGKGGWSFAGLTKDGLTKLAEEFGFSWTIEGGSLKALGDKSAFDSVVVLNGQNGGLQEIAPILQGPTQIQNGVKIKALYVPSVTAGGVVRVNSVVNPQMNGDYKVHTINISLDTFSETWNMNIDSFRYM